MFKVLKSKTAGKNLQRGFFHVTVGDVVLEPTEETLNQMADLVLDAVEGSITNDISVLVTPPGVNIGFHEL